MSSTGALDALLEAGALAVERRDDAPMIAWTSIHGLACIVAFSALPPDIPVAAATRIVIVRHRPSVGTPVSPTQGCTVVILAGIVILRLRSSWRRP